MKKMLLFLMLATAAALLLTGCASSADTLPSPTPGTNNVTIQPLVPDMNGNNGMNTGATAMPSGTAQPLNNGNTMTVESAQQAAQAMKEAVIKLFDEVAPRFKERPGGYTRIVRTRTRLGDASPMAVIALVD